MSELTRKHTTMVQVAEKLGVSRSTVSRVLSGTHAQIGVTEETAERVKKMARRMGYRRHAAAFALNQSRFDTVGVLVSATWSSHESFDAILVGINDALAKAGKGMMVIHWSPDEVSSRVRFFEMHGIDGLIATCDVPEEVQPEIKKLNVPVMWVNAAAGLSANNLLFNDEQSGWLMTRHLIELGHRRIHYVNCSGDGHYSVSLRWQGYLRAMHEAVLEVPTESGQYVKDIETVDHLYRVLDRPDRCTAYACYNDSMAFRVYQAARRLRLEVPQDISVISVGGSSACELAAPPLTSVQLPEYEMGEEAVEMLLKQIRNPKAVYKPQIYTPTLNGNKGESCLSPVSNG